jgi:hypothetical protein
MATMNKLSSNEIIIFKTEDEKISGDVRLGDETVRPRQINNFTTYQKCV